MSKVVILPGVAPPERSNELVVIALEKALEEARAGGVRQIMMVYTDHRQMPVETLVLGETIAEALTLLGAVRVAEQTIIDDISTSADRHDVSE